MGWFEHKKFKHGTMALATLINARSKKYAYTLVGGGETLAALHKAKAESNIDFISTGGGAMIEYLYNNELPGIKALK